MKVLMVLQHMNLFRNLETVVRELDARGHETVMLHGTRLDGAKSKARMEAKKQKMAFMGRGIGVAEAELSSLSTGVRPEPGEARQLKLRVGRLVINRGVYLRKGHPSPERVVEGLEKAAGPEVTKAMRSPVVRFALGRKLALRVWRRLEVTGAPSETIMSLIRSHDPDVVLVSPSVWPKSPIEADYVFAARRLGIPTVGYLNSWDNLTSKGTVHVLPDVFIVWNEALAAEAEQIHLISRRRIRITGAPHLDHFFELGPSLPRTEICRHLGCASDARYLVYLCSSRTLIKDETHIVSAIADALKMQQTDKTPTVVVRPHPVNSDAWTGYDHPGVVVYPLIGDQADTPESWQQYYDQLSGAVAFVGLNTTAFLEAAVVDRPCLTIVSDEFFDQQGRTGHFRHLLDADFLEVAGDVTDVAARIVRVLDGADEKAEGRRRFVATFLRPQGIGTPARTVVAATIEDLAATRKPSSRTRTAGRRAGRPVVAEDDA